MFLLCDIVAFAAYIPLIYYFWSTVFFAEVEIA